MAEVDGSNPSRMPKGHVLVVVALMMAAGGLSVVVDRGHPWILPDSATYLGVAHNIVHGMGITSPFPTTRDPFIAVPTSKAPLVLWPPGYPVLLAVLMKLGLSATAAAQAWSTACVSAIVGIAAAIIWRTTRRAGLSVLACGLTALSGVLLGSARFALSDVVFAALAAAAVYFAITAVDGVPHAPWLLPLLTTAATMVRWIGLILVVPAALACGLGHPRRKAAARAGLQVLVPLLCAAGVIVARSRPPRNSVWHAVLDPATAVRTAGSWLVPAPGSQTLDLVFGALLVTGLVAVAVQAATWRTPWHRLLILVTLVSYLGALFVSRFLFDASTPLDDRILLPVAFLVVVLGVDLLADSSPLVRRPATGDRRLSYWRCSP